jgi:cbb3-type cytochrome oxidase maturation protein
MEALYLLIPLSVVAVFAAAWVFLRMSDSGQFEDMDGPAWSVLHDNDAPAAPDKPGTSQIDATQDQKKPSQDNGHS